MEYEQPMYEPEQDPITMVTKSKKNETTFGEADIQALMQKLPEKSDDQIFNQVNAEYSSEKDYKVEQPIQVFELK